MTDRQELLVKDRKEVEKIAERVERAGKNIMGGNRENHAGRNEQCG